MRIGKTYEDERKVATEAMLTEREAQLLVRVRRGQVPCPWCDRALGGELVTFELPADDLYICVRLSCSCGFVEY